MSALILDAARDYVRKGWNVTPISIQTKRAMIDDWANVTIQADKLSAYFNDGTNVGVVCGPSSEWRVDIDLDCSEAVAAAPYILPRTGLRHGRASKRTSHYWYVCKDAKTTKFQGPGGMMLEIRAAGSQTVVWPSIHPSGEQYEWEEQNEPTLLTPEELTRAAAYLAIVSLLSRHWPDRGSRNDACLALAGGLIRAGVEEPDVFNIVETVTRMVGDERDVEAATAAVNNTIARLDTDGQATGLPKLKGLLRGGSPSAILDCVVKWLAAIGKVKDLGDGRVQVTRNDKGKTIYTRADLHKIVGEDAAYKDKWAFNEMTLQVMYDGRVLTDERLTEIESDISRRYQYSNVPRSALSDSVRAWASKKTFHPVKTYLEGLVWDGAPRLENMAVEVLGSREDISKVYVRKWAISAVARVYEPGCKVDTTLILIGKQGARKSTFFREMAGVEFFSDTPIDLSHKDAYMQIHEPWIYEFAEFEGAVRKADVTRIRNFLSSSWDSFRAPYAREVKKHPRSCSIVGTANATSIARDEEGSRRFWIIDVGPIDIEYVIANRDQIWAEAVHLYKTRSGDEAWWLTPEEDKVREERNEDHKPEVLGVDAAVEIIEGMEASKGFDGSFRTIEVCRKLGCVSLSPPYEVVNAVRRAAREKGYTPRLKGKKRLMHWVKESSEEI